MNTLAKHLILRDKAFFVNLRVALVALISLKTNELITQINDLAQDKIRKLVTPFLELSARVELNKLELFNIKQPIEMMGCFSFFLYLDGV